MADPRRMLHLVSRYSTCDACQTPVGRFDAILCLHTTCRHGKLSQSCIIDDATESAIITISYEDFEL